MVSYPGTFAGKISSTMQSVIVSVWQHNTCLASQHIDVAGQKDFVIDYNYVELHGSIILKITTTLADEICRNNPLTVDSLIVDQLFSIPHLPHQGKLIVDNVAQDDLGNCIWCAGELAYEFYLPMISNMNIT